MELRFSLGSPFARKVRIVVRERGLSSLVTERVENPHQDDAQFLALNPLGKVPVLATPDGAIFDSPVICEYLIALEPETSLLGCTPGDRMRILRLQALADGIMDAAVASVLETRRSDTCPSAHWLRRWSAAIHRGVDAFARTQDREFDLGGISMFCALAYLDFRFPDMDWRRQHPGLSSWVDMTERRASCIETKPQ